MQRKFKKDETTSQLITRFKRNFPKNVEGWENIWASNAQRHAITQPENQIDKDNSALLLFKILCEAQQQHSDFVEQFINEIRDVTILKHALDSFMRFTLRSKKLSGISNSQRLEMTKDELSKNKSIQSTWLNILLNGIANLQRERESKNIAKEENVLIESSFFHKPKTSESENKPQLDESSTKQMSMDNEQLLQFKNLTDLMDSLTNALVLGDTESSHNLYHNQNLRHWLHGDPIDVLGQKYAVQLSEVISIFKLSLIPGISRIAEELWETNNLLRDYIENENKISSAEAIDTLKRVCLFDFNTSFYSKYLNSITNPSLLEDFIKQLKETDKMQLEGYEFSISKEHKDALLQSLGNKMRFLKNTQSQSFTHQMNVDSSRKRSEESSEDTSLKKRKT